MDEKIPHYEPELALLPQFRDRGAFLDVGASFGIYSYAALKLGMEVIAFEPDPDEADRLERNFGGRIMIHRLALSDKSGAADLLVSYQGDKRFGGRSTIEDTAATAAKTDPLECVTRTESITVQMARIDDLDLPKLGMIKIDAEGHETAVLAGGEHMIKRDTPVLLIEAEDRHKPDAVASTIKQTKRLGYRGYFLWSGELRPINEFDTEIHQNLDNLIRPGQTQGPKNDLYINNFLFIAP